MMPGQVEAWTQGAIDLVLQSIAASPSLRSWIVLKGAQALRLHLSGGRRSKDVDGYLTREFEQQAGTLEERRERIREELRSMLLQSLALLQRTDLSVSRVEVREFRDERTGEVFPEFVLVVYLRQENRVRPPLPLELSPSEPSSQLPQTFALGSASILVQPLERVCGEKLRAFLSSLPSHRRRMGERPHAARVRDLYDLAQVARLRPTVQSPFWEAVSQEFVLACRSRKVECAGMESFAEGWENTRRAYEREPAYRDIGFDEVHQVLLSLVSVFAAIGVLPITVAPQ